MTKEERAAYNKEWRKNNPEKVKLTRAKTDKKFRESHPERFSEIHKKASAKWRENNPEKNKAVRKQGNKKYKENNPEKVIAINKIACKKWRDKNPSYHKEYYSIPKNKIIHCLRSRIYECIKSGYKSGASLHLLGCSAEYAKQHIESQFKPGMTWDNHGLYGWHIDHIKPLKAFPNLDTDPEQQKEACHYTNLQPLWAKDNLSKGAKIIY